MLTVWPHLFHTDHLNNPLYHTAGWEQSLPNGPSRTNLFEAIIPRRLFLWSFPSDSRDYLLLAIENNWMASGDIPFLWRRAATIEKVRVNLWGKAICPLCGHKVWRDQQIRPLWRNTIARMKGIHKVAKVLTSKGWKVSQNICLSLIITDYLIPLNTFRHLLRVCLILQFSHPQDSNSHPFSQRFSPHSLFQFGECANVSMYTSALVTLSKQSY